MGSVINIYKIHKYKIQEVIFYTKRKQLPVCYLNYVLTCASLYDSFAVLNSLEPLERAPFSPKHGSDVKVILSANLIAVCQHFTHTHRPAVLHDICCSIHQRRAQNSKRLAFYSSLDAKGGPWSSRGEGEGGRGACGTQGCACRRRAMACTLEKVLGDARTLLERLKEHDNAAEGLIDQSGALSHRVRSMREVGHALPDKVRRCVGCSRSWIVVLNGQCTVCLRDRGLGVL